MKITATMLAKDILKYLEPRSKVKLEPKDCNGYVIARGSDQNHRLAIVPQRR
jgi:hypothetical protein